MTILYFSATGNNLYLAKEIGGELVSIPQAMKNGTTSFSDDKIGLVFPVYHLSVPSIVAAFIKTSHFQCDYLFAVLSYGMFGGAAPNELKKIVSEAGASFSYINTIQMVDNWVPGFDMAKQKEIDPKKKVDAHLANIVAEINASKKWICRNGLFAKLATKIMLKRKDGSEAAFAQSFTVEDNCTKCGTCAKVCPVGNIVVENAKPVFDNHCIRCLACTQNCPPNAIRLPREKSRHRYRNPHISLQEIIQANKQ